LFIPNLLIIILALALKEKTSILIITNEQSKKNVGVSAKRRLPAVVSSAAAAGFHQ
jgi:hypothetical protein